MTPTPHLHALAMRTKAAGHCKQVAEDCKKYNLPQAAGMVASVGREILALPLEADHAALLAEAVKLPEIAALIKAATRVVKALDKLDAVNAFSRPNDVPQALWDNLGAAKYQHRTAILALETP